jgi:DNA-binding NtrC family response regulator
MKNPLNGMKMEASSPFDSKSEHGIPASATLAFVVDDEEIIASTLAMILRGSGFEAVAFTQPLEALRAAEVRCPAFLITDVAMPVLNGIDLAIQFKAIYPRCRVLLFSGALSTSARVDGAREKGFEFPILAKPVHPMELLAQLKQLAEQKH